MALGLYAFFFLFKYYVEVSAHTGIINHVGIN